MKKERYYRNLINIEKCLQRVCLFNVHTGLGNFFKTPYDVAIALHMRIVFIMAYNVACTVTLL